MIAVLVVLFFAVTGITLNHPEWTLGDDVDTEAVSDTFPFDTELVADDDTSSGVDLLSISEYVRDTNDVRRSVDSFDVTNGQGSIVYENPGYSANPFFDADAGTFDLTVEQPLVAAPASLWSGDQLIEQSSCVRAAGVRLHDRHLGDHAQERDGWIVGAEAPWDSCHERQLGSCGREVWNEPRLDVGHLDTGEASVHIRRCGGRLAGDPEVVRGPMSLDWLCHHRAHGPMIDQHAHRFEIQFCESGFQSTGPIAGPLAGR